MLLSPSRVHVALMRSTGATSGRRGGVAGAGEPVTHKQIMSALDPSGVAADPAAAQSLETVRERDAIITLFKPAGLEVHIPGDVQRGCLRTSVVEGSPKLLVVGGVCWWLLLLLRGVGALGAAAGGGAPGGGRGPGGMPSPGIMPGRTGGPIMPGGIIMPGGPIMPGMPIIMAASCTSTLTAQLTRGDAPSSTDRSPGHKRLLLPRLARHGRQSAGRQPADACTTV